MNKLIYNFRKRDKEIEFQMVAIQYFNDGTFVSKNGVQLIFNWDSSMPTTLNYYSGIIFMRINGDETFKSPENSYRKSIMHYRSNNDRDVIFNKVQYALAEWFCKQNNKKFDEILIHRDQHARYEIWVINKDNYNWRSRNNNREEIKIYIKDEKYCEVSC